MLQPQIHFNCTYRDDIVPVVTPKGNRKARIQFAILSWNAISMFSIIWRSLSLFVYAVCVCIWVYTVPQTNRRNINVGIQFNKLRDSKLPCHVFLSVRILSTLTAKKRTNHASFAKDPFGLCASVQFYIPACDIVARKKWNNKIVINSRSIPPRAMHFY